MVGHVNLADVVEDSRCAVLDDGVGTPRVPQLFDDVDGLVGNAVSLVVVDNTAGAEVVGRRSGEAGDQIPAGPSVTEVVKRKELACQVVRMLQRGRAGDDKSDAFGDGGQRRGCGQRFKVLSGLVRPCCRWAEIEAIGEEQRIQRARFGGLRMADEPASDTGSAVVDVGVSPWAGRPCVAEGEQVDFPRHSSSPPAATMAAPIATMIHAQATLARISATIGPSGAMRYTSSRTKGGYPSGGGRRQAPTAA